MGRPPQLASVEVRPEKVKQLSAPVTKEAQETTEGTTLDAAALDSLRVLFLLLDEWDRALLGESQDFCEEYQAAVDSKPS